jgi:hypothetical protein
VLDYEGKNSKKIGGIKMKVAIIGSRGLEVPNLEDYVPAELTEVVSGGACGVDTSARNFAIANEIKLVEFLPEYDKYGRRAPLVRNLQIIEYSDIVLAFWDGVNLTPGTKHVIDNCKKKGVELRIISLAHSCDRT